MFSSSSSSGGGSLRSADAAACIADAPATAPTRLYPRWEVRATDRTRPAWSTSAELRAEPQSELGVLKIGRHPTRNRLVLDSVEISKRHCRLFVHQGHCHVQDDGSSHGTHVNGRRLAAGDSVALLESDSLVLGHVRPIELSLRALEPRYSARGVGAQGSAHGSVERDQRDLFSRLGSSEDLLRLVLEWCDLPALRAARSTEKRMARLCRHTIGSAEWRAQPANARALRLTMWEEGSYVVHAPCGHGGSPVRAVAIGAGILASGGDDGTLRLSCHSKAIAHPDRVLAVDVSSWLGGGGGELFDAQRVERGDARWRADESETALIATGCADGAVRVWQPGGRQVMEQCSHRQGVSGVAFVKRASRPLLLSGGVEGSVRLWDVRSGACEAAANAHSAPIRALAADDTFGLSGSADATAKVCPTTRHLTLVPTSLR
mgnify:CR=1 FL=1|tara:strand:- start:1618 stop:2916 length:1299 start_codon:yes stop_codon:yes gene_type:complete